MPCIERVRGLCEVYNTDVSGQKAIHTLPDGFSLSPACAEADYLDSYPHALLESFCAAVLLRCLGITW